MAVNPSRLYYERQRFPLRRVGLAPLTPPCVMLGMVIWQVGLGHSFGYNISNGSLIGWTVFLWMVYLLLVTTRLVTEVRGGELSIRLSGLWRRARRVRLTEIDSVEKVTFDPVRDFGGYGFRGDRQGKAYVAYGGEGLRVRLVNGAKFVVGSQRSSELADVLRAARPAGVGR